MKRIGIIFTMFLLVAVSAISNAQAPADYFVGDWKVIVTGTPNGDAEMTLHLERTDGKLTGEMRNEGMDASKLSQVVEQESSLTVYFNTMGYDISLSFDKVDDSNIKGSMMGMFDAKGERISE